MEPEKQDNPENQINQNKNQKQTEQNPQRF